MSVSQFVNKFCCLFVSSLIQNKASEVNALNFVKDKVTFMECNVMPQKMALIYRGIQKWSPNIGEGNNGSIYGNFNDNSKLMIYLAVFNHNYMSLGEMSIIKLIKAMI